MRMGGKTIRLDEAHVAEPPGVVIGDGRAGLGFENDMVVCRIAACVVRELSELGAISAARNGNREAPRHAQVNRQHLGGVEMGQDVFGPALQPIDPSAHQPLGKSVWQREPEIRPAQHHATQNLARQHRLQSTPHRLDLGKLRHASGHPV